MPYELWLAFPEIGVLSPYQLGMVRHFIISKLEPKSFNENEVDSLRAYYDGDDEGIMERLLQQWMKMHLKYLHWYASSLFDYSLPLCSLFSPPVFPTFLNRSCTERLHFRYGIALKAWDLVRSRAEPKALTPLSEQLERVHP